MEWRDLIIDAYGRVLQILEEALDGLTPDDLNQQPHPDCNSIGWLAWHLTRVQDRHIASLMGEEQLWLKDKWYAMFSRAPDPPETGFGHRSEDVIAFNSPDVGTILGYHRTVLERTKHYLSTLSTADLDREPQIQPPPTVGMRLIRVLSDNLQHAGQVAYLRGLLKGKGWSQV